MRGEKSEHPRVGFGRIRGLSFRMTHTKQTAEELMTSIEDQIPLIHARTEALLHAHVSRTVGGDSDLADDIVQETWFRRPRWRTRYFSARRRRATTSFARKVAA